MWFHFGCILVSFWLHFGFTHLVAFLCSSNSWPAFGGRSELSAVRPWPPAQEQLPVRVHVRERGRGGEGGPQEGEGGWMVGQNIWIPIPFEGLS